MALPTPQSPTLAAPRISAARFEQLLRGKASPATAEAAAVYQELVASGVDPSFALAQFRVESQYGTAGHAKVTGSWGNMLWDRSLCLHAEQQTPPGFKPYCPGNGFCYATYNDYTDAILDYCHYVHDYAERRGLETIYEATAEWIGRVPGSSGHVSYVNTIVNDMVEYENPPGTFYETGDMSIYAGSYLDKTTGRVLKRYPIHVGMELFRGTNGDFIKKYSGTPGNALFLGFVNGAPDWGVVDIGILAEDPKGTLVYIKRPDPRKLVPA